MKIEDWKHARLSDTAKYQITCGDGILSLRSIQPTDPQDLGAVKQLASLDQCCGKRVRFKAEFSTTDTDAAGLWLTASNRDWHVTDGMYDRLVNGTSDWQSIALVIDVLHIRIVFGRLGASIWPANRIVFGHPAAFNFGRPGALIWPANRMFLAA